MRPLSATSIVASGCLACMRRLTIACLIAASTLGTFVIVAPAQTNPYNSGAQTNPYNAGSQTRAIVASAQTTRAPWWPPIFSPPGVTCLPLMPPCPVVKKSYSDIPWHQKLGTYVGNELDEALILPYGALPPANQTYCTTFTNPDKTVGLSDARCMIETGINSILSFDRTDTLYDWQKSPDKIQTATRCNSTPVNGSCATKTLEYCNNPSSTNYPCIEVNLGAPRTMTSFSSD